MLNKELLKSLRKEKKMTQGEVAKQINRSRQAYAFYENGTYEPDNETLIKLSELFNIDVGELMGISKTNQNVEENTIVLFGRGEGRKEYKMTNEEIQVLKNLIETMKNKPTNDNF